MYNKNIEYDMKKANKTLLQETPQSDKENIEVAQLTEAFENLKLCRMMDCSLNELEEVKKMVNKLTKTVNDVMKSLRSRRNSESRRCFTCQKIGHISCNCPNKQQDKGGIVKEKESIVEDCLRIEIDSDHAVFDIKPLEKWHYIEVENTHNKKEKTVSKNDMMAIPQPPSISDVLKEAINKDEIEVREVLPINDQELMNTDERDDRTIQGLVRCTGHYEINKKELVQY
ncbi:5424_t:CDS:2 [Dentiscutata erythropus]|uniref:5424_t:CDS:1 n=1 Tax=Dentiscutata erythropus TaxID=1348616 RepID=A0A9N9C213_9GLOM|nr:5424_t:CDS:2 [Dentiscutata erythropus]